MFRRGAGGDSGFLEDGQRHAATARVRWRAGAAVGKRLVEADHLAVELRAEVAAARRDLPLLALDDLARLPAGDVPGRVGER